MPYKLEPQVIFIFHTISLFRDSLSTVVALHIAKHSWEQKYWKRGRFFQKQKKEEAELFVMQTVCVKNKYLASMWEAQNWSPVSAVLESVSQSVQSVQCWSQSMLCCSESVQCWSHAVWNVGVSMCHVRVSQYSVEVIQYSVEVSQCSVAVSLLSAVLRLPSHTCGIDTLTASRSTTDTLLCFNPSAESIF